MYKMQYFTHNLQDFLVYISVQYFTSIECAVHTVQLKICPFIFCAGVVLTNAHLSNICYHTKCQMQLPIQNLFFYVTNCIKLKVLKRCRLSWRIVRSTLVKIGQATRCVANVCLYGNEAKEENKMLLVSGPISFAFRSLVYFYFSIRKFGKALCYFHIHLSIRFLH